MSSVTEASGQHHEPRLHESRGLWAPYWRLLKRTWPEGMVRMFQLSGWSAMW